MPTSMRVCFHAGLMVLAYYGAARLGLLLAFAHSNVTPLWPPSGIAVAGLLLLGLRYWPVLFLSSFLVNVTTGQSAALSTTFAAGNTCEYVLAAYILRRFAFDMALRHPRDVAPFSARFRRLLRERSLFGFGGISRRMPCRRSALRISSATAWGFYFSRR